MEINSLPDDCLLLIFRSINVLDVLVNCLKVCRRWESLIAKRLRPVRYLMAIPAAFYMAFKNVPSKKSIIYYEDMYYPGNIFYVYFEQDDFFDDFDAATLLPHLQIVDVGHHCESLHNPGCTRLAKLFSNSTSIKGIIHLDCVNQEVLSGEYCRNLEMVATKSLVDIIDSLQADKVKQLCLMDNDLSVFSTAAERFPNIERFCLPVIAWFLDEPYKGPVMEKLKILEINFEAVITCNVVQCMDSCPALKSAFIMLDYNRMSIDESIKLYQLEDLVIEMFPFFRQRPIHYDVNRLFKLLGKYPNLKHLLLLDDKFIQDNDVKYLVKNLTKLVLLDLSKCEKITQASAEFITSYCWRTGREIKFYYSQTVSKFAKPSKNIARIGQGVNFMDNFDYRFSPLMLDPIE